MRNNALRRWPLRLLATTMAVVALTGGGAWACVVQPLISISPRSSAAAGSQVTVEGENFQGPIELRWNGLEGQVLATAPGPTFSLPIAVPRVQPGLYTILALGRAPDASIVSTARAEILVTGPIQPVVSGARPAATGSIGTGTGVAAGIIGLGLLALGLLAGVWLSRRRTGDAAIITAGGGATELRKG